MKKRWIPFSASLAICVLSAILWYVEHASVQSEADKLLAVQSRTDAARVKIAAYKHALLSANGSQNAYVLPDGEDNPAVLTWLQAEQQKTGVVVKSATLTSVDASAQKLNWIGQGGSDIPPGIGLEQLSIDVTASDMSLTRLLTDVGHSGRYMQVQALSVNHADGGQQTASLQVLIAYKRVQ